MKGETDMWLRAVLIAYCILSGTGVAAQVSGDSGTGEQESLDNPCLVEIASATQFKLRSYSWLQRNKEKCSKTPGYEYFKDIELVFDSAAEFSRSDGIPYRVKITLLRAALSGSFDAIVLLLHTRLDSKEEIYLRSLAAKKGHFASMEWLAAFYSKEGFVEESVAWKSMQTCGERFLLVGNKLGEDLSTQTTNRNINHALLNMILKQLLSDTGLTFKDHAMEEEFKRCVAGAE